MTAFEQIKSFYEKHLHRVTEDRNRLSAPCPFCRRTTAETNGRIDVDVDPDSYFRGRFRCTAQCTHGGFHVYFGRLMGLEDDQIPGFDPDAGPYVLDATYPPQHLGAEITQFAGLLGKSQSAFFDQYGVSPDILKQMMVGFNGRYLVYPYVQDTGFAYAARCVMPHRPEDHFWHGNETFFDPPFTIFNVREIDRCRAGALFVTDGELNCLILEALGYPAIAVPAAKDLADIAAARLKDIDHVFLLVSNTPEADLSARKLAQRVGFKARILSWPSRVERGGHLTDMAVRDPAQLAEKLAAMIDASTAFSPFSSPAREQRRLLDFLETEKGKTTMGIETGLAGLDAALDGLRGINILGGPPKAGKSMFFMQISTEVARRRVPVIYYDFENGRQKIYLRTIVRLSGIPEKRIRTGGLDTPETETLRQAMTEFKHLLHHFRVVTDRELNPDSMRRHIEFLQHETGTDTILVVLDSLHKLPFKDLSERRSGIDFWLRQLETMRDDAGAHFLVISELARGKGGNYGEKPDLGSFKASGDIAYSADNAMVLMPNWDPMDATAAQRSNLLWLVASRENSPGRIAEYTIDYPFWRFTESGTP